MRHLKIYESFVKGAAPEMDLPAPEMDSPVESMGKFETETTEFKPTKDNEEGDYVVNFLNPDGEETTIHVGYASDPEYVGSTMISNMEMVPNSSSDGRTYSAVGHYDEIPGSDGAYELKRVLIGE